MHDIVDYLFVLIVESLIVLDSTEVRRIIANSVHFFQGRITGRKKLGLFLLNLVQSPSMSLIGKLVLHLIERFG